MAVKAKKTEPKKKAVEKEVKEPVTMKEVVYTRKLNVRSEPKPNATVIAIVSEGERFKEIKSKSTKDWACIEIGSEKITGYALKSYLK